MMRPPDDPPAAEQARTASAAERACAFAVHVFTASGAVFALLALLAAVDRRWTLMFVWLGAALVVDSIDGTIARYFRVSEVLPRWSGDNLDFVVDFVTYVFVPAYAIAASGLLPATAAVPAGIVIVVTGALYFADRSMKMVDNCFRGFPALWNVAAFYLFVVKPPAWLAVVSLATLAVLTFAPFPFVHPIRVARLRAFNVAVFVLWVVLAAAAVGRDLDAGPWIAAALCAIGLYFLGAGLLLRRR
jgi:phosphatidylcholine synthase